MSHDQKTELIVGTAQTKTVNRAFIVMIVGAIVIALVLVNVAMVLYHQSGTAQLDLSRPSYESVRSKVQRPDNFTGFSASGSIDKDIIDDFLGMYDEQVKSIQHDKNTGFSAEVMSDEQLEITVNR